MSSPTIYDVAAEARVSASTVSHVLNSTRKVSEETRALVEAAVHKLSYRQNNAARILRDGRTKLLGLILPDVSNSFFSDIAHRIELLAYDRGMRVVTCNSDYDHQREASYIDDLIQRRVDGIMIAPVISNVVLDALLKSTGIPAVLLDRVSSADTLPSVAIDNGAASILAADHLYGLGHRKVGCITSHPGLAESTDRRTQGFLDRLSRLGHPVADTAIAYSDFRLWGGLEAASRLLDQRSDLTALFCANDMMAVGAIRAATAAGRRVPSDLSVMGFDDSREAQIAQPPLTTIAQPLDLLAETAMRLLRDPTDSTVRLGVQLVVRGSTARPTHETSERIVQLQPRRAPATLLRRVLLAGAGIEGEAYARALWERRNITVVGVYDPEQDRAETVARRVEARACSRMEATLALDDVDGLVVTGASPACLSLIEEAARRGVHILCDTLRLPNGLLDQAMPLCESAGVVLQAGLAGRTDLDTERLASAVRKGEVGRVVAVQVIDQGPWPALDEPEPVPCVLLQPALIDDMDLIRFVLGEDPDDVVAFEGPKSPAEGTIKIGGASVTMRFPSMAIGSIAMARSALLEPEHRVSVLGSHGSATVAWSPGSRAKLIREDGSRAFGSAISRHCTKASRQVAAFIAAVSGQDRVASGHELRATRRIADAAALSAKTGQVVSIKHCREPGGDLSNPIRLSRSG